MSKRIDKALERSSEASIATGQKVEGVKVGGDPRLAPPPSALPQPIGCSEQTLFASDIHMGFGPKAVSIRIRSPRPTPCDSVSTSRRRSGPPPQREPPSLLNRPRLSLPAVSPLFRLSLF